MRSRLAATIVAANFSFGIPYAAGRPSAARDDRVSCIQKIDKHLSSILIVYKMANVKSPPIFSARNARQINLIVSAAAVKSRL